MYLLSVLIVLTAFCHFRFDRIAVGLLRSSRPSLYTVYFTLVRIQMLYVVVLTACCLCSFDRRAVGLYWPSFYCIFCLC